MKGIAVIATSAMTLLNAFGAKSSVGGPLTDLFVSVLIIWAVGIHFAWSKRFGVLGWMLSMVVATVCGVASIVLLALSMDAILELSHFQGRLIDTNWVYVASATMALVSVIGAWVPLALGTRLLGWRRHQI